jgi:hypothetical protein
MTDGVNLDRDTTLNYAATVAKPMAMGRRGGSLPSAGGSFGGGGGFGGGGAAPGGPGGGGAASGSPGGGFGGRAGSPAPSSGSSQGLKKAEAGEKGRSKADDKAVMTPAQVRDANYQSKVDKKLRESKAAKVEVQVWLRNVDAKTLAALKKLGLTVDTTDMGLKIVFGSITPKKLVDIAQLDAVKMIIPLE